MTKLKKDAKDTYKIKNLTELQTKRKLCLTKYSPKQYLNGSKKDKIKTINKSLEVHKYRCQT